MHFICNKDAPKISLSKVVQLYPVVSGGLILQTDTNLSPAVVEQFGGYGRGWSLAKNLGSLTKNTRYILSNDNATRKCSKKSFQSSRWLWLLLHIVLSNTSPQLPRWTGHFWPAGEAKRRLPNCERYLNSQENECRVSEWWELNLERYQSESSARSTMAQMTSMLTDSRSKPKAETLNIHWFVCTEYCMYVHTSVLP